MDLEVLRDLAKGLMNCHTEEEICWEIARGAIKKIGLEDCVVYLLNPETGFLEQRAAHGPKNPVAHCIANPIEIKLGAGVVGHAAASLTTTHVPDTSLDARYIIDDAPRLSELAVPIISDQKLIGVIDSENSAKNFFTPYHILLLEAVALIAETRFATTNLLRRIDENSKWLTRTKREYQAIFNNSPSGVIVCTQDMMVTEVNRACVDMLNMSPDFMVGQCVENILGREAASLIAHLLMKQRRGEPVPRTNNLTEVLIDCAGGTQIHMNIAVAEIDDIILIDCQDMTEFRKLATRLELAAETDSLTQVLNRASFEIRTQQVINRLHLSNDQLDWYLCVVDIDRFKDLNDQFGHALGDRILCYVAAELRHKCKHGGHVGRLGGDEFGALIATPRGEGPDSILSSVLTAVASRVWMTNGTAVRSSLSIGAVKCSSLGLKTAEYLMAADAACYQSKAKGRNCFTVADHIGALVGKRTSELAAITSVRKHLSSGHIELHAQPIVSLRHDLNSGYEVLARIRQEDGSLLLPGQFMSAVERGELAPVLDLQVLDKTIKWLHENPEFVQSGNFISVNLSGHTLSNHSSVTDICNLIDENKCAAPSLILEVTETVALQDIEQTNLVMHQLKQHGVRFALDDFGVGVSSLAYLKHLPVDVLKIDGGFIKEIHNQPFDEALVCAIQSLANALGIVTVAEWVECKDSMKILHKLGIDMAQGYVLGKPTLLPQKYETFKAPCSKTAVARQVAVHH